MEIQFRTLTLQKVCNSCAELSRHFGDNAVAIQRRLQFLLAADDLSQIPREKPMCLQRLSGKRSNQWSVDVRPPWRLIFQAVGSASTTIDDVINLDGVRTIEILGIDDKD